MDTSLSFVLTADGSKTLFNPVVGEHYHSRHGALQESWHVFLDSGLKFFLQKGSRKAAILEVGFGTGLNFLLSAEYALDKHIELYYTGIEAFPPDADLICRTDYDKYVSPEVWTAFTRNYERAQQQERIIAPGCTLNIAVAELLSFSSARIFDVVYFDAFAAVHQPEMWTEESLRHVSSFLSPGGVFVTYAITGNLKRIMKSIGFSIEKAPGAAGKREMLRAVKL